jgi:nucleoside-diphosphate-sugar epimerase
MHHAMNESALIGTRFLVTGASGLLGRRTFELLRSEGANVVAIDRTSLDLSRPIDPEALPEQVDAVVYLAQSRRFRDFPDGADDVFRVNTAAPLALAAWAHRAGAQNFVYASTGGVYALSAEPLIESSPLADPMSFYHASKRSAELLLAPFASHFNVVILRYFFIYGPGQAPAMLVPRLVDSVREGRPISLQGEDGLRLRPIHVDDAARATIAATRLVDSATINVAGPQPMSLREMGKAIAAAVGREPVFEVATGARPASLVADIGAMTRLLGAPGRRFQDAIGELVS